MPATDDLVDLLNQLRTNATLQAAFRSSPSAALESFDLTAHERDAVMTRDLDDFVALGVVASISELPEVLRGERAAGGSWLLRQVETLRRGVRDLLDRRRPLPTRFDVPRPRPQPGPPQPGPPRPEPRPGPDPPGPGD
jgi:hypothetical protein